MSYKIEDIEGIGPAYAKKLSAASIATTDDLLDEAGELGIEAMEQSKAYYDSAREKTLEIGEALKEKSVELYNGVMESDNSAQQDAPDPNTVREI